MELVNITDLTNQLLIISSITKVVVDLLKTKIPESDYSSQIKVIAAYLIPILITVFFNVSLFETNNEAAFYIGAVGAGVIAGLGSTFIHEILKSLQTLKTLKK
jgi:ABC-type uncharacterized transport system permease subunit